MGAIKSLLSAALLFGLAFTLAAADPASELASFSVFDSVDLTDLAKSEAKTAHGPPMNNSRYLSVQSVWVAPGSPAQQVTAMRNWSPTKHKELKILLHADLSGSPGPADFSQLAKAPDSRATKTLLAATQKQSAELQVSKEEAKKLPSDAKGDAFSPEMVKAWSDILSGRARAFAAGGSAAQPAYDHTGENIRPNEELNGLLKEQPKIRKQFSDFLGGTGIGRGGSGSPDLYWELLEADDQGVLTLGATYSRGAQAADCLYYASGGYYVAVTLYQFWPVTVEGKASSLVWRGDMISSASLASLHGVEKLASESAMMKDVAKAVALFRRDSGGR